MGGTRCYSRNAGIKWPKIERKVNGKTFFFAELNVKTEKQMRTFLISIFYFIL